MNGVAKWMSDKVNSKQFMLAIAGLGLIALVLVPTTGVRWGMLNSSDANITAGESNPMATINAEYDVTIGNDSKREKKILQISILGERNSGTRWSWR